MLLPRLLFALALAIASAACLPSPTAPDPPEPLQILNPELGIASTRGDAHPPHLPEVREQATALVPRPGARCVVVGAGGAGC